MQVTYMQNTVLIYTVENRYVASCGNTDPKGVVKPGAFVLRRTPGFLKSFLLARRYVCLCLPVCPPPRALITSGVI